VALDALGEAMPGWAMKRLHELAPAHVAAEHVVIQSDAYRSQTANRQACRDKLRALLVRALARPKKRRPTRPGRAAKQRRLDEKKRRGQIKQSRGQRFNT